MDNILIDTKSVTPHKLRIYEELMDIELPLSSVDSVFPKKKNTLSYAFEHAGVSLGYYKILSVKAAETQGFVTLILHKQ
jgi:hypothetical protein